MSEIFNVLEREHEAIERIMNDIEATTDRAEKKREDLLMKLNENIVPHMKGEEKALYPVLLEKKPIREQTLEGIEEHKVANTLLKELLVMPRTDERWHAKFSVLKENVMHHVAEEEGELFTQARKLLEPSEARDVLELYDKEEKRQKESLLRRLERKVAERV